MIYSFSSLLAIEPTKNESAFKRPVSVHRKDLEGQDKKFDIVYVLQHYRY